VEESKENGKGTEEKEDKADHADVHQEDDEEGTDSDEDGGKHAESNEFADYGLGRSHIVEKRKKLNN